MGNPINKVSLVALEAVRIRVDGEKQNFETGDIILVAENLSGYYLKNGFGFEKEILEPINKKETTEIKDEKTIEAKKEEQAEIAKAETKKSKGKVIYK